MSEQKNLSDPMIRRLKNLKMFKDKSEDEIREYYANRPVKASKLPTSEPLTSEEEYDQRFSEKLARFQEEFAIDMNDSNDAMNLENLVRHSLQLEDIDKHVRKEMKGGFDSRSLKNWGDMQRSLVASISEIQDKLGISRRQRKEKQIDDIPQYISGLRKKALEFYERKTLRVICKMCDIELARVWINFADLASTVRMELECWKCHEKTIYIK